MPLRPTNPIPDVHRAQEKATTGESGGRAPLLILTIVLALALPLLALPSWARALPGEGEPAAQEVIVKFEHGASPEAREAAVKGQGARIVSTIREIDAALVELPAASRSASERARALASEKAIIRAEPNTATTADWTPNDKYYDSHQWNLRKVGAPTAWNTARGTGVRLAILDTGVQNGHPDINGKVVLEKDYVDGDNVAQPVHPHGTHVAGIAAARTNNTYGIAGACPSCTIIDVRISDSRGASTAWRIAQGLTFSANNGARAINISSGGPGWNGTVADAAAYAYKKGALVVASAGNDDRYSGDYYPAGYANVVGVTSTNRYDRLAADANRGPHVDVAAPGVGILSTIPNAYKEYSGTSQAAPHVTGLAGLIAGEGVSTPAGVRNRILSTAKDLGPAGRDDYYGYGRVNFAAAVR